MADLPFMPFAVQAFLADCGHLDDADTGRYLKILMALWLAPQQRIPNLNSWLAKRFQRTEDQVDSELRPIIKDYCQCDGNWIRQKRLTAEFQRAATLSKKRSEAAKARWNIDNSPSKDGRLHMDSHSDSHTHTLSKKTTPSESSKKTGNDPKPKPAQGSRIAHDWAPALELRHWALEHGISDVDKTAAMFLDYWTSKAGGDARKTDWPATFRNWCRNELDRAGRRVNGRAGGGKPEPMGEAEAIYRGATSRPGRIIKGIFEDD